MKMSGGGPSLYRRGGASDSTNLDAVIGFDERQLLVNYCHQLLVTVKTMILQSSLSTFIVSDCIQQQKRSHLSAPHRTARHVRPRLAMPRRRLGSARRASARARVVHQPPLTGFTSDVHRIHPLSRLRSSPYPDTKLSN